MPEDNGASPFCFNQLDDFFLEYFFASTSQQSVSLLALRGTGRYVLYIYIFRSHLNSMSHRLEASKVSMVHAPCSRIWTVTVETHHCGRCNCRDDYLFSAVVTEPCFVLFGNLSIARHP